jgi:alpha-amylase
MVKRGQVEIISGGYYEPILPIISHEDRVGQISLMNEFIEKEFAMSAKGIWTAERVWEPYLAKIFNNCNLKYTFLDDTHFRFSGLRQDEFFGYYTTEEEGSPIAVFPISKTLRYKIPFSQAHEAISVLESFRREDSDVLVTLFDDGEKFGLWPQTFDWVYNQEWLKKFLSRLESNINIETITPQQAATRFKTNAIVYLPTASYEEMGEWVLKAQDFFVYDELKNFLKINNKFEPYRDFIRGGFFRNFYNKYSRLNYMQKRMLVLSREINSKADFKKDRKIFINLYKAQTNCSYWHGVFGGFYLGHIRSAVYENLISAENMFDEKYNRAGLNFKEQDIDLDSNKEIIVKNQKIICCFSRRGASLLEMSLRESHFNLINTVTRQEESYHKKIRQNIQSEEAVSTIHNIVKQKDKDLDKYLIYDQYERLGLLDHLLDKKISLDDFNLGKGINTLSDEIYAVEAAQEKGKILLKSSFHKDGLSFSKNIEFSGNCGFKASYKFDKKNILKDYNFGIEFNMSFASLEHISRKEKAKKTPLGERRHWPQTDSFVIADNFKKIIVEFSFDRAEIFTLPIYSVSSSESGFEKVYQEIAILFIVKERETFNLALNIKQ